MEHCECGNLFTPTRKNQKYCKDSFCRRKRKREWQKNKLKSDPDYRASQNESQAKWRLANPGYWRRYREKNLKYTENNRKQQRHRNKKRPRKHPPPKAVIANMDTKPSFLSGTYCIFKVTESSKALIANMDAKLVQIQPFRENVKKNDDCKERTHTQIP